MVTPFLTYFPIQRERPAKYPPLMARVIPYTPASFSGPLPVGLLCPLPMTPEQVGLLDAQSPCANAINKVLNTYFPYHIPSAAVCQYQYFKETQYAIQRTIEAPSK